MKPKTKNVIAIALIPQIILVKWLAHHPGKVETYYSEGIYPIISKSLRWLLGWIPISIGDVLYAVAIFFAIRYLYKNFWFVKKKMLYFLRDIVAIFSIIYFAFHLLWGLNYYRLPLTDKLGITADYDTKELMHFTEYLIDEANTYQFEITADSLQPIEVFLTKREIYRGSIHSYSELQKKHPTFKYVAPSVKSSLFSLPLTYMGYGGYLNPFTNEAQVNYKIPAFRLFTISGHEIGHQVGYSAEDATNFLGFLASKSNPNPYYKYGACNHALAYCLSDVYTRDQEEFNRLYQKLNPGVRENYKQLQDFWKEYENPTEPIFKSIFNAFLKANNQEQGIESYNYVVGLLIGYHETYGF